MQPWALQGGPDEDTLKRLIEDEKHSDSEIAELFGVKRQTVAYWRMKIGILKSGPGHGPRRRRGDYASHKDLIWWRVQQRHMNHPIRKRLVEVSLQRQGLPLAPDAEWRVRDFLAFLERENVVVTYDPDHRDQDNKEAPFYFVPRNKLDAKGDIVRR